eukprot:TRINITY_DN32729_c0_g1_i1.p1 TRINITY_DN32729_c0_g1~~TRINITY_DN32729_c0_g1_i1.p1  ORF type:complete len:453 (-),score=135.31 TRINITY_DN32729_c0_g1_i1:84-1322(-)
MSNTVNPRRAGVDFGRIEAFYEWTQTDKDVTVTAKFPDGLKVKDIVCDIQPRHLRLGVKGQPLFLDGPLSQPIILEESTWTKDGNYVEITLTKGIASAKWWPAVVVGQPTIDVSKIEGSQHVDDSLNKRIAEAHDQRKIQEVLDNPPAVFAPFKSWPNRFSAEDDVAVLAVWPSLQVPPLEAADDAWRAFTRDVTSRLLRIRAPAWLLVPNADFTLAGPLPEHPLAAGALMALRLALLLKLRPQRAVDVYDYCVLHSLFPKAFKPLLAKPQSDLFQHATELMQLCNGCKFVEERRPAAFPMAKELAKLGDASSDADVMRADSDLLGKLLPLLADTHAADLARIVDEARQLAAADDAAEAAAAAELAAAQAAAAEAAAAAAASEGAAPAETPAANAAPEPAAAQHKSRRCTIQ